MCILKCKASHLIECVNIFLKKRKSNEKKIIIKLFAHFCAGMNFLTSLNWMFDMCCVAIASPCDCVRMSECVLHFRCWIWSVSLFCECLNIKRGSTEPSLVLIKKKSEANNARGHSSGNQPYANIMCIIWILYMFILFHFLAWNNKLNV